MFEKYIFLGSKARVKKSETKLLQFDSILGNLVTTGTRTALVKEWYRKKISLT
jgi:hypothetical protein